MSRLCFRCSVTPVMYDDVACDSCQLVTAPDAKERDALASMRNELLEDDWAYWHNDPAVDYLNRLLGPGHPPFVPDHMRETIASARGE